MAKADKRSRLRWDDLRYVLAIARAGSVAGAARQLEVSASTVVRRLEACERATEQRLFDRLPNGVSPTPAGQAFIDLADHFESRLAATRDMLARDRDGLAGRVTLTTFEGIGLWVAERLETFRAEFPDIQVDLQITRQMREVRAGQADLALWAASRPRPELVGRRVATVAFAIYGQRDRALSLDTSPWIVFDEGRKHTPQGKWEAENVSPDRVAVRVSSRALYIDLVSRGLGLGVVPCALAAARPELERFGDPIPRLARPLWLLFNPDHPQNARARALTDFLAVEIGKARPALEGQ